VLLLLYAHRPPGQDVSLAVPQRVRSTPIYVAIDQGYFRDEGIEPILMVPASGKDALTAVLAGKADFGTVAALPIVEAVREGRPPSVLAAISHGDTHLAIVTAAHSGIETLHDLKGKRVAITPGTATEAYLAGVMRSYGLAREDVEIVPAAPPVALERMRRGELDAVSTWEQWVGDIAAALGTGARILRDEEAYFDHWYVVGPSRSGPPTDLELRLMRALARANAFIQAQPKEAAQIMRRSVQGSQEDWLGTYFDLQLDSSVVLALQATARLTATGEPPAALVTALRPGPLATVSPETVDIAR